MTTPTAQYWAVCSTHPQSEPIARREIEDIGIGTFLPSFARYFYKGKEMRERRKPLLPGYVFVCLNEGDDAWGAIGALDGVSRVLTNAGKPVRILASEVAELMIAHATGRHNVTDAPRNSSGRYSKRRRRPRPGKIQRESLRNAMAVVHGYRNHTVLGV